MGSLSANLGTVHMNLSHRRRNRPVMLRRCETLQLPAMCTVTCTSIADTCSHVPKHVPGGNQRLTLQQTHESRARNVRLCKPCPDCTRANSCKRAAPIQAPAALVQARAPDGSPIPAVHSMRMLCSVSCEPRASCRAKPRVCCASARPCPGWPCAMSRAPPKYELCENTLCQLMHRQPKCKPLGYEPHCQGTVAGYAQAMRHNRMLLLVVNSNRPIKVQSVWQTGPAGSSSQPAGSPIGIGPHCPSHTAKLCSSSRAQQPGLPAEPSGSALRRRRPAGRCHRAGN